MIKLSRDLSARLNLYAISAQSFVCEMTLNRDKKLSTSYDMLSLILNSLL